MRRLIPLVALCGFTILLAFALNQPGAQATGCSQEPVACAPGWSVETEKKKEKGKFDPPDAFVPTEEVHKEIQAKTAQLAAKIAELRKDKKHAELLPDVEIFLRGAENIVRFKEYYHKDSGKWTLDTLDRGMKRAEQLATGQKPWTNMPGRNVVRGYRSIIDGTAQPYGVTYPLDYGKDLKKPWRVDVVLHGRNGTLTEVSFANTHNGKKKVAVDQDWVQIDIYGRGNNAYRWAGETDVLEAMEAFFAAEAKAGRASLPDRRKVVLRGFSMGGAGTWHLGLHHPDKWCVMGPGAGFTTTHDYAWKGKKELPDYQERCLRIYDAIDYAENARMIPIVAYSGGDDAQKLAADNIENRLKELKIDGMTHIVAPGLGHSFPAEWVKKANELWSVNAKKGRAEYSKKVSFVTYTTKYSQCDWVTVVALEKHYEKATVTAEMTGEGCQLRTTNVREIELLLPVKANQETSVSINGKKLKVPATSAPPSISPAKGQADVGLLLRVTSFTHEKGEWRVGRSSPSLRKGQSFTQIRETWTSDMFEGPPQRNFHLGLQGPIDEAFTQPFVCVLGSGDTWHPGTQKFVDAKVAAFKHDWAKHWRGELPTTGDYAVTPNDINDKNLILFGDPSSNLTLAQMMPKLPLKWTKDEIEFAGQKFKTSEHVPVLIFPNPLNPRKYVVLNTGHTFPSEDYAKTNALLYPRLGDYAVLRMTPTGHEVAIAGLFDEFWRVEKK